MKKKLSIFLLILILFSCKKDEIETPINSTTKYSTLEAKLLMNQKPIQLIGVNAFHVFGVGSTDMNTWKIDIIREFIGNIKETPLTGSPIKDATGAYLYSLENIIADNRANKRVTIICAFGWDGTPNTAFTGRSPQQTNWWQEYKTRLKEWATYLKDQPDVWIEVWNEPYRYDRADGYTDQIWLQDMNELVAIIRSTGNQNIVVVPCAEQGQDESVLLNKGNEFLNGKSNILFDIHAYEKWLLDSNSSVENRLNQLRNKNIPIIIGEIAPMNAGVLMNPKTFLDTMFDHGLSICAWVWKKDGNDIDALLTTTGEPNNNNNNNWGTTFKDLTDRSRKP
ncbi:cellulase family glycosylhydrolase [Flavobacterium polysaccharolyticum]|uniref:Cellulase family glycosylhydrolase n=1 Tax=Flavobacterium polysaccharolyticum TaxID=3133148 RepID=A0ABU9NTC5_9FLAO